jgi:hypothetical protein
MLSIVMLSVIMLSVVMLTVVMLSVVMINVDILSVVVLLWYVKIYRIPNLNGLELHPKSFFWPKKGFQKSRKHSFWCQIVFEIFDKSIEDLAEMKECDLEQKKNLTKL